MNTLSYKQIFPKINTLIFDVDGVLTNGIVTVYPNGELLRQMNTKDGYALKNAVKKGFKVCIISGGKNESVKHRLQDLGITDIYLKVQNKINIYNELLDKYNLNPEKIMYMGDDMPDLEVMQNVGMPCCPNDAAREIQEASKYISNKNGGDGAVRDVIEQILRVQGKWKDEIK